MIWIHGDYLEPIISADVQAFMPAYGHANSLFCKELRIGTGTFLQQKVKIEMIKFLKNLNLKCYFFQLYSVIK